MFLFHSSSLKGIKIYKDDYNNVLLCVTFTGVIYRAIISQKGGNYIRVIKAGCKLKLTLIS
jgi:hypothetical protein